MSANERTVAQQADSSARRGSTVVNGPFRSLFELWWVMLRRRWTYESSLVVATLSFPVLLVALARSVDLGRPAGLTAAYLVSLGNATVLSASVDALSLSSSRRLSLLPLTRRTLVAVHLFLGTPLRPLVFVSTMALLLWGLVGLGLPVGALVLEATQGIALLCIAALASTVWARPSGSGVESVARGLLFVTTAVGTVAVIGESGPPPMAGIPAFLHDGLAVVAIGSRGPGSWELAAAVGLVLLLALALRVGSRRLAAPLPLPRTRRLPAFVSRATRRLWPQLRKEVLLLWRMVGLRPLLALSFAPPILAVVTGTPAFLLGLAALWFGFFLNAMGADVPCGGWQRYRVAGHPVSRVLRWRHLTVLLAMGAVTTSVGLVALASGALDRAAIPALAAYLVLTAAVLLLSGLVAGSVALRYPVPRLRTALFRSGHVGPAVSMLWALGGAAVVVGATLAALAACAALLRQVTAEPSPVSTVSLAGVALTLIYLLGIRRGWHALD